MTCPGPSNQQMTEPRTQAAPSPDPPAASLGRSGTKGWGQTLSQADVIPPPILFWRGPLPGGPAGLWLIGTLPTLCAALELRALLGLSYGLSLVTCPRGGQKSGSSSRYGSHCHSQESRMLSLPARMRSTHKPDSLSLSSCHSCPDALDTFCSPSFTTSLPTASQVHHECWGHWTGESCSPH